MFRMGETTQTFSSNLFDVVSRSKANLKNFVISRKLDSSEKEFK